MSTDKTYLGDGVYLDWERGMAVLTTENGLAITNTIYLEPKVAYALIRKLEAWIHDT